jgi:phospholipid transport system substrate-binding protein
MLRRFQAIAASALLLAGVGVATAGIPTDQLRTSVDHVLAVLKDPALKPESKAAERREAIRHDADAVFDFTEMSRRALGRHWQELNESQQQEFVKLFADLLERAYVSKIEKYSGEKIDYVGESVEGDMATVKTQIVTKEGTPVPIDYRLLHKGDRWLVYDVLVEGVSLVLNYRTQFDHILQTSSYDELVRRLKANQAEYGNRS